MWKRSDLKRNAKTALKANYLKCMLAGIILLFAAGSQTFGGSSTSTVQDASDAYYESMALVQMAQDPDTAATLTNENGELTDSAYESIYEQAQKLAQNPSLQMLRRFVMGPMQVVWDYISGFLGGASSFLLMLLGILVLEPICVGGARFFLDNAKKPEEQTSLNRLTMAFRDRNYMNIVLNLLWRDIMITLWSLLLVIPGIIKSYEYRMVPYLLAEYPEMRHKEVFQKSKEMMHGQKWRAFVLDWSFFLWDYVSILTFGLAGIFFVYPYEHAVNAELYLELKRQEYRNEYGSGSWNQ